MHPSNCLQVIQTKSFAVLLGCGSFAALFSILGEEWVDFFCLLPDHKIGEDFHCSNGSSTNFAPCVRCRALVLILLGLVLCCLKIWAVCSVKSCYRRTHSLQHNFDLTKCAWHCWAEGVDRERREPWREAVEMPSIKSPTVESSCCQNKFFLANWIIGVSLTSFSCTSSRKFLVLSL